MRRATALLFTLSLVACGPIEVSAPTAPSPEAGAWRAWLVSPGGELPFGLELTPRPGGFDATLVNGEETIDVPDVSLDEGRLSLRMPHYDSEIVASVSDDGRSLYGSWVKRASGADAWTRMTFHATAGAALRFAPEEPDGDDAECADFAGRWSVAFESSDDPAVGVFEVDATGLASGTFLTTTGDYRYLAGRADCDRLRLSCFDGAHAFLFDAAPGDEPGTLAGGFWSRDTWFESWTAQRDAEAALPDPFELSSWVDGVDLNDLIFRDLDGIERSLADEELAGPLLIELFGSWCPNCNDAAAYLAELHESFGPKGLKILGLAFELTGDFERDAEQVRVHAERFGLEMPLFVAGTADKDEASAAFPALDRVRAYPTFILLDPARNVRGVHTGFSGPATGEAHRKMKREIESRIRALLREATRSSVSAPARP